MARVWCAVAVLLAAVVVPAGPAAAVTIPEWARSWYFTRGNSTAHEYGCILGQEAASTPGTQNYVAVLALGSMFHDSAGWNFNQFGHTPITDDQGKQRAQQFAAGYYGCKGSDTSSFVRVAIGTNNSAGQVTYNAGKALANRVDEANAWLDANGFSGVTGIFGANDIELDWGPPAEAKAWTDGYRDNTYTIYYDTGDAAGCSTTQQAGSECGTAAYPGWTANDVWYVADRTGAMPLPQIYR